MAVNTNNVLLLLHLVISGISLAVDAQSTSTTTSSAPSTTLNNTASPSVSTTNPTPTTTPTTSTTKSPTTVKPKPAEPIRSPFCFCDQYVNKCEINCCCDLDCTPAEKQIFSSCMDYDLISRLGVSTKAKEKACYRQEYIYSNNTPFLIHHKSNNLFCIVSNNFKQEPVYDVPLSKFKSKFVKPGFRWTSLAALNIQKLKMISTTGYKYGSPILSAQQTESQNGTKIHVQYFELPSNVHGKSCLGLEPLKFLQNSDVACEYEMHEGDLATSCESVDNFNAQNYFSPDTPIVGRIDLKSTDDKLISLNFTDCKDDKFSSCGFIDGNKIPAPKFQSKSKQCKNVLKNAQMTLVHEGMAGISSAYVQLQFMNVSSAGPKSLKLQQQFKVRYLWKDEFQALIPTETNATATAPKRQIPDLPKSGNPGYTFGKEVIAGTLVTNEDVKTRKSTMIKEIGKSSNETLVKLQDTAPDDQEPFGVALLHDTSYYLSIINAGTCHQKNRRPILFGMNMKSSCDLPISRYKYCEELKADLGLILLGTNPANFSRRIVASFGDPFILQSLNDWIPITLLNNPFASTPNSVSLLSNGCSNGIITSLHVQIIFAHVGPVVFPQAQIRGIIYEFGDPIGNLKPRAGAGSQGKLLSLSTTVEFQDITSTPTHKIAQWPTISIQLPSDFFYPFSSSKAASTYRSRNVDCMQMLLVMLISVFGFYLYAN